MDTSIFKYGELPEFKKFTPENISKQFPVVLEKIAIFSSTTGNCLLMFSGVNFLNSGNSPYLKIEVSIY